MAVYFNHHFDIQGAPVNAWSKSLDTPPVLAVALSGNAVGVYTEDGQPLDNSQEQLIRNVRGCEASQLTWHPVQPLLAIGWADGALSLWLLKPRRISGEESARHRTAIAKLAWSPDGERLYSADGGGRVAVWSCSAEWRPQLLASFDVPKSSITHLVPMQQYASPTGRRSSASDEPGPAAPRPSSGDFLFSTRQADDASVIYKGSDKGTSAKLFEIDSHLLSVFYYADKDQIICVASTRILTVHGKDGADAPWKVLTKLKFSTGQAEPSGPGLSLAWAGPHTLASASGTDTVVRMFNFDTEDNFTLELPAEEDGAVGSRASDTIALLHYDPQLCCLAAATASGKMAVFRHSPEREQDSALDSRVNVELAWEAEPVFRLKAAPLAVAFGPSIRLLSATCTQDLTLCRRARLQWRYCNGVAAVQTSANQVMVVNVEGGGAPRHITCDVQVQGLAVNKEVLALSDGKLVKVYGLSDGDIQPLSSFATTSPSIAVFSSHVIKAGVGRLELLTPQGVVKQTVEFDAVHGQPILMDGNGKSLVVLTNRMAIRVFTLRGRQMKETSLPGSISAQRLQEKSCSEPWGEVESMRVNCQGSKVSLLMHDASDRTRFDSRLLLYDVELDLVDVFDFQKDKRTPVYHCWDTQEPKLLAVQTRCRKEDVGRKGSTALPGVEITTPMADSGEDVLTEVATLFATAGDSQSLILQEYQELRAQQWLVAISAPQLVVCNQGQGGAESRPSSAKAVKKAAHSALVTGLTMRSFAGMDVADDASRQALLDFSFKLSTGDMAGASAAFRVIKNPAVWESMAAMCVKNKRLDVLELCLSNLEHVRGARALREAAAEEEADARIGLAALHLGLTEDAAKLFEAAGRYDLLNRLHQARGEWDAAVDLAESHDRVHLASIRHERGRALEMQGDVQGAIREYEAAGTHHTEVPRLLASLGCMDDLEQYVQAKPQPPLQRWLARWYESRGQNDKALPLYQAAKDMLAQVRLLCLQGDYEGAKQLVADSGDPAAAFELARKLEANDLGEEAIEFYRTAGRLPHAVRLAQKFGMEQKVFKLAQQSSKAAMLDTAQYFQDRGEYEKAAVLFQKAGLTSRALKMCFDGQLYEALSQIADDLNDTTDPQVLINCAEFFLQQGEIGRAAALLIRAGQQRRALQLCEQESVPLTEEMAEGLSPEKGSMPEPERLAVLAQVARLCKHQGAFQVAAKKYTQAGERKKALKMLMRAGDWEKVVFFANVSRSREIFEAAADYLVTLSWHCQPEVMRSIIAFYKKAKASQKLAAFWESCAQLEIDEYRDYYKALDALRAALQLIQKPDGSGGKAEEQLMARASKLDSLQRRINLMERFTRAMENEPNEARPGNPQMMLQICEELIMEVPDDVQDSEACIRVGDVYSMVIGYYDGQRQWQQAYSMMEQMRNRGIVLNPYLDRKLIERVCQGAGVDIASLGLAAAAAAQPGAADTSFTEGDIAEEVVEEASDV